MTERYQARRVARAMGTVGVFQWSWPGGGGAGPADGFAAARLGDRLAERWTELDRRLSNFRLDSDVARGLDSPDVRSVRTAARRMAALTGGLFCAERDGLLDTGGIGKGYAADQLCAAAVSAGASDVLITLGTSSIAHAGGGVWVGLSSPWLELPQVGRLYLDAPALSVSADPGRSVGAPGARRRSRHAIDPRTGQPAETDLAGVVVCGPDGMACEALSTAYLVAGRAAAMRLDQQIPEVTTIFFGVDGRMHADPALRIEAAPGLAAFLQGGAERRTEPPQPQ